MYVKACTYIPMIKVRFSTRTNNQVGQLQQSTVKKVMWVWSFSQNVFLPVTHPSCDNVRCKMPA